MVIYTFSSGMLSRVDWSETSDVSKKPKTYMFTNTSSSPPPPSGPSLTVPSFLAFPVNISSFKGRSVIKQNLYVSMSKKNHQEVDN